MAVFHGKDAKPGARSSQSADTEFTEENPFVFSVRSVSALHALCDQKNAGQPSKIARNHIHWLAGAARTQAMPDWHENPDNSTRIGWKINR
jgi:hypothetical protein